MPTRNAFWDHLYSSSSSSSSSSEEELVDDIFEELLEEDIISTGEELRHEIVNFHLRTKRKKPKSIKERRKFDHARTLANINRDFLGPDALFGAEFKLHFRISRSMYEYIFQEVMKLGRPFHITQGPPRFASVHAHILLPLHVLAYGTPPNQSQEYFQMGVKTMYRACREFD